MLNGTPVIGFPNGATKVILSAIQPKFLAKANTAEALAEKIECFLNLSIREKQKMRKMSKSGVKLYLEGRSMYV
jgi:hypothetical protein